MALPASPTLTDLSDRLNREDAACELDRAEAAGEAALAAWARKWGRPAIEAVREAPCEDDFPDWGED